MNNKDISKQGYKNNSPYRNSPYLFINSPEGVITMNNVDKPLLVKDLEYNETKVLKPNSGNHTFKGTNMLEIPLNNNYENNKDMNMFNNPSNKKLWKELFDRAKMKMGGYAMPNEIIEKTITDYTKKKGGFIIDLNYGKRLPFLENKQDGGEVNEPNTNDFSPQVQNKNGSTFEDWIASAITNEALPENIKDELDYFKRDEKSRSKLNTDYAKKYMPDVYAYWQDNNTSVPVINDFETRKVTEDRGGVKMQYGGYTSQNDYVANKQMQTSNNYTQGTRIRYKSGGTIKEGVIKSYNSQTGKIQLY